ncbi:tumor necrosis factor ligand superfamily member 10-like isoform X2 [Protopterus annectens]|uniref:tumor necrosis factor ligand superfamily member 10-like isoform X2 n=1 Tax=Protopterus annectens TaxID=7888 RepID=UPI001CFB4576|nr:tumor necrosis factor ligand superfamily member 10-like isoform X2 [Protopterus annectens]
MARYHSGGGQDYFTRSDSSDSSARMMPPEEGGCKEPEKNPQRAGGSGTKGLWIAGVLVPVLLLQGACTAGLFWYFSRSISEAKTQGILEELKCLEILNNLNGDEAFIPKNPEEMIYWEACTKLAENIKSYITTEAEAVVGQHVLKARFARMNVTETQMYRDPGNRPSAHLTLREPDPQGHSSHHHPYSLSDLHQSCRHPIRSWDRSSMWSHLQNLTYHDGRLKIPKEGKYFIYSQIYFRYPVQPGDNSHASTHQLVQCVHKKTSYVKPILLLKGVGTRCWAPNAEYGLHSVYQGGLFDLKPGDEIFVTVSSPSLVYANEASSYFGVFKLEI